MFPYFLKIQLELWTKKKTPFSVCRKEKLSFCLLFPIGQLRPGRCGHRVANLSWRRQNQILWVSVPLNKKSGKNVRLRVGRGGDTETETGTRTEKDGQTEIQATKRLVNTQTSKHCQRECVWQVDMWMIVLLRDTGQRFGRLFRHCACANNYHSFTHTDTHTHAHTQVT